MGPITAQTVHHLQAFRGSFSAWGCQKIPRVRLQVAEDSYSEGQVEAFRSEPYPDVVPFQLRGSKDRSR